MHIHLHIHIRVHLHVRVHAHVHAHIHICVHIHMIMIYMYRYTYRVLSWGLSVNLKMCLFKRRNRVCNFWGCPCPIEVTSPVSSLQVWAFVAQIEIDTPLAGSHVASAWRPATAPARWRAEATMPHTSWRTDGFPYKVSGLGWCYSKLILLMRGKISEYEEDPTAMLSWTISGVKCWAWTIQRGMPSRIPTRMMSRLHLE